MFKPKNDLFTKNQNKYHNNALCLLSWNVNKNNQKIDLEKLSKKYNANVLSLQEVKFDSRTIKKNLKQYSYCLCPNIEIRNHLFGLLTLSQSNLNSHIKHHFLTRELFFTTRKAFVISSIQIQKKDVFIINVHLLNFISNVAYERELNVLKDELLKIDSAFIIAGDFNAWNKNRVKSLKKLIDDLSLYTVSFDKIHEKKIKRFHKYPLDYILYRGLKLEKSHVIDLSEYSDHNALYASFDVVL